MIRWFIIGILWILSLYGRAQSTDKRAIEWVDSVINVIRTDQHLDSKTKSNLADSAFQVSFREKDTCKQIYTRILQAIHLDNMGMSDSALIQLYWANRMYNPRCDSITLMFLFSNLTNVFLSLGELGRVDSISQIALTHWNPLWKTKDSRYSILINMAIAQFGRKDTVSAINTLRKVYYESVADNNLTYTQIALNNLGGIKGRIGDLDSAYFFFNAAAGKAKQNSDMDNYMSLLINMANLNRERGRYNQAITLLDSAYFFAQELKSTENIAKVLRARANVFYKMHKYDLAYTTILEFIKINEQYLDEQRVKAVTEMMEKYESEKKARQIQQLKLDNLDASLKTERITNTRNHYLYIGLVVLLIAIGSLSRLRYVHRSRSAIQRERDISEGLLLNILPGSVAEELKIKGHADAQHFETATILFSDFKSFTTVSEELSPADLVEEINACFKAFDEIITRYGIEKIKTIGDSYMAAGGIPANNKATTLDVVMAGLEMQQFIIDRKKERDTHHLPAFEMRIGIHSGPVVAGIVGVKKFQYDLWGDTVNTASRMETTGEVGRVNISEATYRLIKDNQELIFRARGLIQVKGKGELAMYFVDKAA